MHNFCKKLLTISFVLIISFQPASSQKSNYHHLILKGDTVRQLLINQEFWYLEFNYKEVPSGNLLEAVAFDFSGRLVSSSKITLDIASGNVRKLRNTSQAPFYLTRNRMEQQQMDGSEDYIFSPYKKGITPFEAKFVSYHIEVERTPKTRRIIDFAWTLLLLR
ncbi:MAG: hypothetical protein JWQ96_1788 [Segetibacter sp.]|nr:hypothetical protein [Segetibacter sp.]